MSIVRLNPTGSNEALRQMLFAGDLALFTELPAVTELVAHARLELEQLFDGRDPQHAHECYEPSELASMLSVWKPRFMRLPESLRLSKKVLAEIGFDASTTHYDLLKPRTSFPQGHLTTGIAAAFPWHRDTWYAAASQQINLWFPIYEVRPDNAMGFDPGGFGQKVPNNSNEFDYYRRNRERGSLSKVVSQAAHSQPGAIDWHPAHEDILLPSPGSILLFSADQLHRSIPNTSGLSRYSIDYRVVSTVDIESGHGAPALDVACTGTAIRDFKRVSDDAEMSDRIVRIIEPVPPSGDVALTFAPPAEVPEGATTKS